MAVLNIKYVLQCEKVITLQIPNYMPHYLAVRRCNNLSCNLQAQTVISMIHLVPEGNCWKSLHATPEPARITLYIAVALMLSDLFWIFQNFLICL